MVKSFLRGWRSCGIGGFGRMEVGFRGGVYRVRKKWILL